jgi:DNA-binding transcriptional regulator YiaG
VETAIREWVRMQQPHFYRYGNPKRVSAWNEGISALADYAEKLLYYAGINELHATP